MTPWADPLDADETAEQEARELSEEAWVRYYEWLNR